MTGIIKRFFITCFPFLLIIGWANVIGMPKTNFNQYLTLGLVIFVVYTIWYWVFVLIIMPKLKKKYGGEW